MTLKMTLSLLLAASILFSLVSLPSIVQAEQPQKFIADTGLILPGPHQKLRLTVTGMGTTVITVRFRQIEYMQDACIPNAVCKFSVSSQTTSPPIALMPGEATSLDLLATTYGRGTVMASSQNARVTLQVVNTITGGIDAVAICTFIPD